MDSMKYNSSGTRPIPEGLREAVNTFLGRPRARRELDSIYDEADRIIGQAGGTCLGGGACCRFDLAEHRVWLTTAELSQLVSVPPHCENRNDLRCPYQRGPDCTARPRRPLGCRTFFCKPADQAKMHEIHEALHRRIARLHETHCIPYAYAEMTDAMRQLSVVK